MAGATGVKSAEQPQGAHNVTWTVSGTAREQGAQLVRLVMESKPAPNRHATREAYESVARTRTRLYGLWIALALVWLVQIALLIALGVMYGADSSQASQIIFAIGGGAIGVTAAATLTFAWRAFRENMTTPKVEVHDSHELALMLRAANIFVTESKSSVAHDTSRADASGSPRLPTATPDPGAREYR